VAFGEPIFVPPGATSEEVQRLAEELTTSLRGLTAEVDARRAGE
jgi:hypothetical protein